MKSFSGADAALLNARSSATSDRAEREQQFDALLAANGPALTRLAASYTNTRSDRDDLFQEIAVAIWQALPRFRAECSERTFLFRIAHNRGIAYLARARSQMSVLNDQAEHQDPSPSPEAKLAQEQTTERLKRAVHRLPLAYRQVVTLTFEGLGYEEIADVLGISESNVGARLNRARRMLRETMEGQK